MPKAQPAPPAENPQKVTTPPTRKIAIVGFTDSREEAPWGKPDWDIWICNNLWKFCPRTWHRLYDLHDLKTIQGDKDHEAFLRGDTRKHADGNDITLGDRPVATFYPQKEWPTAQRFPKDAITDKLGRYYTNSISWMISHALMEGVTELHLYGVDLATGGEYAAQRPSVEYHLGIAAGMGVKIHIPESSDLLKVTMMYGAEDDSPLAAKITAREKELLQRSGQAQQQIQQGQQHVRQGELIHAQMQGALETTRYFKDVWLNPRATSRHSSSSATATLNSEATKGTADAESA